MQQRRQVFHGAEILGYPSVMCDHDFHPPECPGDVGRKLDGSPICRRAVSVPSVSLPAPPGTPVCEACHVLMVPDSGRHKCLNCGAMRPGWTRTPPGPGRWWVRVRGTRGYGHPEIVKVRESGEPGGARWVSGEMLFGAVVLDDLVQSAEVWWWTEEVVPPSVDLIPAP